MQSTATTAATAAVASPCTRWALIDIGLNLTDKMYTGQYQGRQQHKADREAVLERGYLCGVRGLLLTGGSKAESQQVVELCRTYSASSANNVNSVDDRPHVRYLCTVGCHPTRCDEFEKDPGHYYEALDELLTRHSVRTGTVEDQRCVAAVGEVGLDYDRLFFCCKETQQVYFRKQLALAEKHQLPLFLHDRNTGGDFYDILSEHKARFPGGVVHSFTGTAEELQRYLDLGLYIGVNGCSFKTPENVEVVRAIPLDRLMIETDGPWCEVKNTHASRALLNERAARTGAPCESDALLSPFPVVRKEKFKDGAMVKSRCEPCNLVQVLEVLHELHNDSVNPLGPGRLTLEAMAEIVTANTRRLFPF